MICLGPECEKTATRKGMCIGHYEQRRHGKDLTPLQKSSGNFIRLGEKRYYADWSLRRKYGIGIEELEQKILDQSSRCPVSLISLTFRTPCVDHIGTFGEPDFLIRGIITRQANLMLGYLEGLEKIGADLQKITAPHIYEYIVNARFRQREQLNLLARGASCVSL